MAAGSKYPSPVIRFQLESIERAIMSYLFPDACFVKNDILKPEPYTELRSIQRSKENFPVPARPLDSAPFL